MIKLKNNIENNVYDKYSKTKIIFRSIISFILMFILVFEYMPPIEVKAASYGKFEWISKISENNSVFTSYAPKDEESILLRWQLLDPTTYTLSFYAPDAYIYGAYNDANGTSITNAQVAKHIITLKRSVSNAETTSGKRNVIYKHEIKILDVDGSGEYDIDVTNLYSQIMNEWDFTAQPNPGFVATNAATGINYTVVEDNDLTYGRIYQLSNLIFRFYWDYNAKDSDDNETEYFKLCITGLSGIEDGTMYTFNLESGSDKEVLDVLKNIKVKSEPTRWYVKDNVIRNDKTVVDAMKDVDSDAIKPALRLSITSPRIYDEIEKKFEYLKPEDATQRVTIDINGGSLEYNVDQITIDALNELLYDEETKTYLLDVIGHENADDYKNIKEATQDAVKRKYIFRKKVYESSVYSATIGLYINDKIMTSTIRVYTYLAYKIVRKNIDETYVELKPYQYPGKYEVYVTNFWNISESALFDDDNLMTEHNVLSTNEIPEKVYIPISIDRTTEASEKRYSIGIRFKEEGASVENQGVHSEITEYDANADDNITIDVPIITRADNVVVINGKKIDEVTNDITRVAKYDITWDVPAGLFDIGAESNRILKNEEEKLWYEVYMNTTSKNQEGSEYQIADVIYLTRQSDKTIKVTTLNNPNWSKIITRDDKEITAEILVKPVDEKWYSFLIPAWKYDTVVGISKPAPNEEENISKYIRAGVNDEEDENYLNQFFNPNKNDKVPGNYFITMRGLYDPVKDDESLTVSDFGVPVNVVLSESEEIMPIPEDITFNERTKTSIEVEIRDVDTTDYFDKMLAPVGSKKLGYTEYEIFFSKNQDTLNDILNLNSIKKGEVQPSMEGYINKYCDKDGNTYEDSIIRLNNANDKTYHEISVGNDGEYIDLKILREDGVFSFRSETTKLRFVGLDENQTYYFVVRAVLNVENQYRGEKSNETHFSGVSKIYYTSTLSDSVLPEDSEKTPPTPKNFELESDPKDKQINVRWTDPELVEENGITYGYELVRVADERLSEADRNSTLTLGKIYEKKYNEFVGYQYVINDEELYICDTNGELVLVTENHTKSKLNYNVMEDYYWFQDVDVNPNRIYYYYVRTVKFALDGSIINSEWAELTATTVPVSGIENLREITKVELYDIGSFNGYYERVIAFEAPIGDATLGTAHSTPKCALPTTLDFSISMKLATDVEYYEATSIELCAIVAASETKATYVYRLYSLKSGSKYNVRVAVIDKTSGDGSGNYPMSTYSNPISLRTEFSQDDYDKNQKYESYKDYYETELGKIVNEIAFVLENDEDTYSIKYKEERLQGELGSISETTYLLPTNDTATKYTYYITKTNIEELLRLKKGLKLNKDGTTIIIPYNFINEEYTESYNSLLEKYEDLDDEVDDFYLKIWIAFNTPKDYVEGLKTISDEVQISMRLIEQSGLNTEIDYLIESAVSDRIYLSSDEFIDRVAKELKGGLDDKAFLEMVEEEKEIIRSDMEKMINDKLSSYEIDSYSIKELFSPINIKFETSDDSSLICFKDLSNNWQTLKTTHSNDTALAYIKELGRAVLATGADLDIIYGTESNSNAYYAKMKYNLNPILIRNGVLDENKDYLYQDTFIDIAFAIVSVDSENVFELAEHKKEIDQLFVFYNDPLTRQEMLYGVLQLYNMFSPTNINKVVIKNTNIENDLNVESYYMQTILAGIELGLITKNDVKNPNEKVTVNELLDYIYRIIG